MSILLMIIIPIKKQSIYIKKTGGGQGASSFPQNSVQFKYIDIITNLYNKNLDINNNYINVLKYVHEHKEIGDELIKLYPNKIICNSNIISLILTSVTHRMFSKKYFPTAYLNEYISIINKTKLIF